MGRTLSHYAVIRKLGEGGMGVVYLGHDSSLDRPVALKFLPPHMADSVRMEREARAISALNHPNIATIYGIEEDEDKRKFLVLEYLPGGTLRDLLVREGALPTMRALAIAGQIAEGLGHAHQHGIIHCDVKSSNILFTAEGRAKLGDFGIASNLRTREGESAGSPGYASPEQMAGETVDVRSDLYSLGVVVSEMLTGRLPAADSDVGRLRPGLPESVRRIANKCLHRDRAARYQTAGELLRDLQAATHLLTRAAGDETQPIRQAPAPQWRRRAVAGAAVTAVLAAATYYLLNSRPASLPTEKSIALLPFTCAGDLTPAFCDGLIDRITENLAQIEQNRPELRIIPSADIRRAGITNPRQARTAFGVNLALHGSLQRRNGRLSVSATLSDTATLREVQTKALELGSAGLGAVERDLPAQIASMLEVDVPPQTRRRWGEGISPNAAAQELYLRGRGLLQGPSRNDEADAAIELFQQALDQDQDHALAYAGLGEAFFRKFELTQDPQWIELAEPCAEKARKLGKGIAAVHLTSGRILHSKRRYKEAIEEFDQVLRLDPLSIDGNRRMAGVLRDMARYGEAEAVCRRIIKLRPSYWAGYDSLGSLLLAQGKYAPAEEALLKGVSLSARNVRGLNALGYIYMQTGRDREAEEMFKRALEIEEMPEAYTNIGSLYFRAGRYAESIVPFTRAASLAPHHCLLWGNLADAYRYTPGYREKAGEMYRKAVEIGRRQVEADPNDPRALRGVIAIYYAQLGRKPESLAFILQSIQKAPRNMVVLYRAALAYELIGRRDEALATLEEAIKAGYPLDAIRRQPDLASLRQDERFTRLSTLKPQI